MSIASHAELNFIRKQERDLKEIYSIVKKIAKFTIDSRKAFVGPKLNTSKVREKYVITRVLCLATQIYDICFKHTHTWLIYIIIYIWFMRQSKHIYSFL